MRRRLIALLVLLAALGSAASAQAVVVNAGGSGAFGAALVPGATRTVGLGVVTAADPCQDPWLSADLGGPILADGALCYHGGAVIHSNEVFDLAWDPLRRDWSTTRYFVEHYLRNVADSSGSLGTPYAVASQYQDSGGRAGNRSVYGGGCIDYGAKAGSCDFNGQTQALPPGNDYPANGCPVTGTNQFGKSVNSVLVSQPNDVCITDAQIRTEIATEVSQAGFLDHTQAGATPLVVVMTPPGVVDCLDAAGHACSSNGGLPVPGAPAVHESDTGGAVAKGDYEVEATEQLPSGETLPSPPVAVSTGSGSATISVQPPAQLSGATSWSVYITTPGEKTSFYRQVAGLAFNGQFTQTSTPGQGTQPPINQALCSYHSFTTVQGVRIPYVVQPWTALTGCDEPDIAPLIVNPPMSADDLATNVGQRLVSPLSQAELAAITDPFLDGWYGLDGSEINDNGYPNGCVPLGNQLDTVTVGDAAYFLQREFNNGGVIETDPNALGCANVDALQAQFVAPSNVDPQSRVAFDGSKTVSTLVIPAGGYAWDFGDGRTATGPSVVHAYDKNGTYTVTLTVTDRGGYTASVQKHIQVGPVSPPPPPPPPPPGGSTTVVLKAHLQLLPQSLHSVLRSGVTVRISSNLKADAFTTLTVPRAYAKQAHLHVTRAASVVVGRGTVAGIRAGTMTLHVRIPGSTVRRLARLHRLALTLTVSLRGPAGTRQTLAADGRY